MTKEKRFVVDPPSFSLSTSLPLPVCDIHQKVFFRKTRFVYGYVRNLEESWYMYFYLRSLPLAPP